MTLLRVALVGLLLLGACSRPDAPGSSPEATSATDDAEAATTLDITPLFEGQRVADRIVAGQRISFAWRTGCEGTTAIPDVAALSIGDVVYPVSVGDDVFVATVADGHGGVGPIYMSCTFDDVQIGDRSSLVLVTDGRPDPALVEFPGFSSRAASGLRFFYERDFETPEREWSFPVCGFDGREVDLCLPDGPLSGEDYAGMASSIFLRRGPWTRSASLDIAAACDPMDSIRKGGFCEAVTLCHLMRDSLWGYRVEGDFGAAGLAGFEVVEAVARHEVEWPPACDIPLTADLLFAQFADIIQVWGEIRFLEGSRLTLAADDVLGR